MTNYGYEAGYRGLRQIWLSMYAQAKLAHPGASLELPDAIEDKFSVYTGRFLDRMGFHRWYSR